MDKKYKSATIVLTDDRVLIECPFCGRSLITTDYKKIVRLLEDEGTPRGKTCGKCGGIAILRLSTEVKEEIRSKIAGRAVYKA